MTKHTSNNNHSPLEPNQQSIFPSQGEPNYKIPPDKIVYQFPTNSSLYYRNFFFFLPKIIQWKRTTVMSQISKIYFY